MAHYRKKGKKWVAEIKVKISTNKPTIRESRSFNTKAQAVKWATEREEALKAGAYGADHSEKTLKDALLKYLDEEAIHKKNFLDDKNKIYKLIKDRLLPVNLPLRLITTTVFSEYRRTRRKQGVTNSTINREISLLRSVFRLAISEWGYLVHNPLKSLEQLPENPSRKRLISQSEINRLKKACHYEEGTLPTTHQQVVYIVFLFALETAMRLGEIVSMRWENLYIIERYYHLEDSKNGTYRDIPLSKSALSLLDLFPQQEVGQVWPLLESSGASHVFGRLKRKAGLDDLRFHDTRHEAITRMAKKVDVMNLARITGHKDTRSLMIYYNPDVSELADLLD